MLKYKKECNGCAACAQSCPKNCIEMVENKEGFLYPQITKKDSCINCNICEKKCPLSNYDKVVNEKNINAFAVQLKDKQLLKKTASGGAFAGIATDVLNNGGYVCGACETQINKMKFKIIESVEDLPQILGSKYYQCELSIETLKEIIKLLKRGKNLLFGGTPCQVASLNTVIDDKYKENLITMDLICQGVPSYKCISRYRKYKEKKKGKKIKEHYFRSKDKYVEREYLSKYVYQNNEIEYYIGEEDFYLTSFQRQILLRESCYVCPFASNKRTGDITIGDLWNIYDVKNNKINIESGVSIAICNTDKGKKVLENTKLFNLEEIEVYKSTKNNIPFNRPVNRPFMRNISYKMLFSFLGPKFTTYLCCPKYLIKKIIRRNKN